MASKSAGRASCRWSGQPYCPCETMQVARIDEPYVLHTELKIRRCTVYCPLSIAVDTSDACDVMLYNWCCVHYSRQLPTATWMVLPLAHKVGAAIRKGIRPGRCFHHASEPQPC